MGEDFPEKLQPTEDLREQFKKLAVAGYFLSQGSEIPLPNGKTISFMGFNAKTDTLGVYQVESWQNQAGDDVEHMTYYAIDPDGTMEKHIIAEIIDPETALPKDPELPWPDTGDFIAAERLGLYQVDNEELTSLLENMREAIRLKAQ